MSSRLLDNMSLMTVITLCIVYALATAVFNLAPLMVGASIDALGLDEAEAGMLLSAELVSTALMAIALSAYVNRLNMKQWALLSALLALVVNLVSAAVDGYIPLLLMRVLAGTCTGVLVAAVFYFAALSHNPVRMFGIIATTGVLGGAVFLLLLPAAVVELGYSGIFVILALLSLVCALLLWRFSAPVAIGGQIEATGGHAGFLVLLFGVAVVAIQLTQGGYYAFAEQIGESLGMEIAAIGAALSFSYVVALGGSGLASALGDRFGVFIPLLIGMVGHVVGVVLVVGALTEAAYITGVQVQAFFFFLFYPYKLALAAIIDPSGRLSTLTAGLVMLGLGVGPMVTGATVLEWGYSAIAWSVGVSVAVGYLILFYAGSKMHAAGVPDTQ